MIETRPPSRTTKRKKIHTFHQCCGSGSGTGSGSVRIRNFWPDPDPIRNRNKHFGSGFESGSEINQKKEPNIQAKIRCFYTIIHISHVHVLVRYVYACVDGLVGHWINSYYIAKIYIYVPDS